MRKKSPGRRLLALAFGIALAVLAVVRPAWATGGYSITVPTGTTGNANGPVTVTKIDGVSVSDPAHLPSVLKGATIAFTVKPEDGYQLKSNGIKVTINGTDTSVTVTVPQQPDGEYTFTMPEGNVTISAEFEGVPHEVTLQLSPDAGGSVTSDLLDGDEAKNGDQVTLTVTPAAGYVLQDLKCTHTNDGTTSVGLNTSDNVNYTFTMPNADVTVFATFKQTGYAIKIDDNIDDDSVTVTDGADLQSIDAAKQGDTVTLTTKPAEGYEVDTVTVTYANGQEVEVFNPNEVGHNKYTFTMPPANVTVSVTFKKAWYEVSISTKGHGAITLNSGTTNSSGKNVAQMNNPVTFTVTPDTGNKLSADGPKITDSEGRELDVSLTRDGTIPNKYSFEMPDSDVIITADFIGNNQYYVEFNSNGGTSTMDPLLVTAESSEELTANKFSREGYTFNGWATTSDGTVQIGDGEKTQSVDEYAKNTTGGGYHDVTLYAVWEPNKYTVHFDANGGEGEMKDQDRTYDDGEPLTPNEFTRDGYTFYGWAKASDSNAVDFGDESVANIATGGEVTLHAVWATSVYTVKFDANAPADADIVGKMANQRFAFDVATPFMANALFDNSGKYVFAGWSTVKEPDEGDAIYFEGNFTYDENGEPQVVNFAPTSGGEVTLYAQWELVPEDTSADVYRLYNPNSGEHFFTTGAGERDALIAAGWSDEGVAWRSIEGGEPVYRVYNPNAGEHHFTTSAGERDALVAAGWSDEGISFHAAPAGLGEPVYRAYNPNAFANNHHFTASRDEYNSIISAGWRPEGVAWYAAV